MFHTFGKLTLVLVAIIGCLVSGCNSPEAKKKPEPLVIFVADRSASTENGKVKRKKDDMDDWTLHTGLMQIVMNDESGLGFGNFYTHIFAFSDQLGLIYQGRPQSWEEVSPTLDAYIRHGEVMGGGGTLAKDPIAQIVDLAEINSAHPIFVVFLSDLLLNDVDDARGEMRKLLKLSNVKVFFAGPVTSDPVLRQQYTARLIPADMPQSVDRVIIRSRADMEPSLRESVNDFREKYINDEQ